MCAIRERANCIRQPHGPAHPAIPPLAATARLVQQGSTPSRMQLNIDSILLLVNLHGRLRPGQRYIKGNIFHGALLDPSTFSKPQRQVEKLHLLSQAFVKLQLFSNMNSDSSQPSTPRMKQERVRVQKIRNCCDACSISKTKCDQTRPTCARCVKNGLDCNYSVSQRKGKPPAASRNLGSGLSTRKIVQEKPSPEPSILPSIESSRYDMTPELVGTPSFPFDPDTPMSELFLSYDDVPSYGQGLIPDMNDFPSSAFAMTPGSVFDNDFSCVGTPSMERSSSHSSNDNYFSLFPNMAPQPTSTPSDFTLGLNPLPTLIKSESHSPAPRFDCAKLASSTLESLNLNAQACKYAYGMESSAASLDQILIATKAAVENTHELLSCPCSSSQHSNLMVSCIIDKILGLYQTSIRAEAHASAARSSSPSSDGSSSNGRRVSPTPITIGAYQMDAKDEQRMRMQLVSNELRKAATLVERYSEKYRSVPRQDREDAGVSTALVNLLRRRLREAGTDINNALRSL